MDVFSVRVHRIGVFLVLLGGVVIRFSSRAIAQEEPFRFEEKEGKYLHLHEGDKPLLTYVFGMELKEGAPKEQRRSSYIHPVWGLDGEVLTDDFPRDHYHHRGIFWAWAQVTADGTTHDPWAVVGMMTRFEKWLGRETRAEYAVFAVNNGWYVGEKKVVDEKARVTVWRADEIGRPIDIALRLEATGDPVVVSGRPPTKGYGGFGVRFAPRKPAAAITMADGRTSGDVIGEASPWADYSARFHDRATTSGLAVFLPESHPGFPAGWLLRHYGYIGPTWPGLGKCTLEPNKPLVLNYRVYIHRGDAVEGHVEEAYGTYSTMPAPGRARFSAIEF